MADNVKNIIRGAIYGALVSGFVFYMIGFSDGVEYLFK